jgi:hypothetical protein
MSIKKHTASISRLILLPHICKFRGAFLPHYPRMHMYHLGYMFYGNTGDIRGGATNRDQTTKKNLSR